MTQLTTSSKIQATLAPLPQTNQTIDRHDSLGNFIQETLALTKRLFINLQRRPSTLIAGIIQPFMWLILFGALFSKAPQGLFGNDLIHY